MEKSIDLLLGDEKLVKVQRILRDEDEEEALRFLKTHLGKQLNATIYGKGHCRPCFKLPGRSCSDNLK